MIHQMENSLFDPIKTQQIKNALLVIRAINHEERQQILNLIDKEMTVTEIRTELNFEQSKTSQDLATLRKANLVKHRRDGKRKFYIRNEETIAEAMLLSEQLSDIFTNGENTYE